MSVAVQFLRPLVVNRSDTGSTVQSISKAFSVLYVYDYFLTLGDEVCLDAIHSTGLCVHEINEP